ncbi:hypothetical protein [Sorangium sp. So ce1153]|uniref:hypothetical protein n=1 Tax=Sorangium sp. So ce1153 TaxID=3133333 RepID=UPI003F6151C2
MNSAELAWQQFLALNRKAAQPDGQTIPRGTPQSDALGGSNDLLVWQTYAHKTELRPNAPLTLPWDKLGAPTYANAYQVTLYKGTSDAQLGLWNNLDEDSEIASCQLFGQYAQQPRARRQDSLVLFEAKVNRDEYEYIRQNYPDQNVGNLGALTTKVNNPERASGSSSECDGTGPHGSLCAAQLNAQNDIRNGKYDHAAQCSCPPDQAICLPCGDGASEGAIEVKAAWRKLLKSEDATQYYTSKAVYHQYEYDPESQTYKYRYYNDTFALIGLHIIRKMKNYPDFVFTSFEHVGEASAGDQYVTLDNDGAETSAPTPATRQSATPNNDRTQNHAIPEDIQRVNALMRQQLRGFSSVWANYQLIGVQADVTNCGITGTPPPKANPGDPDAVKEKAGLTCISEQDGNVSTCLNMNPNYYMANLFVETDKFLNNFSGPGFGGNTFGTCDNTVYGGKTYNMGGCKGCHGVAQTAFGTDFSFLLDFGQGKPGVTPDTLQPPYADLTGMKVSSSKASATPVPGPGQECASLTDKCFDFCRYQCETKACVAYNVSKTGCEIFPQDVPMSSLSLTGTTGYSAFLAPGTVRPPTAKTGQPQEAVFPGGYLRRSERKH